MKRIFSCTLLGHEALWRDCHEILAVFFAAMHRHGYDPSGTSITIYDAPACPWSGSLEVLGFAFARVDDDARLALMFDAFASWLSRRLPAIEVRMLELSSERPARVTTYRDGTPRPSAPSIGERLASVAWTMPRVLACLVTGASWWEGRADTVDVVGARYADEPVLRAVGISACDLARVSIDEIAARVAHRGDDLRPTARA